MELGTLEREIHVDASPEVVFEVISRPEHIREWWSDDASLDPTPGAVGEVVWGDRVQVAAIVVVDVDPPRRFAFRWTAPDGEPPAAGNSLLVTFDLEPSATGTRLRLTESGFRERAGRPPSSRRRSTTTSAAGTCSCPGCSVTRRPWSAGDDHRDRRRPVVGRR